MPYTVIQNGTNYGNKYRNILNIFSIAYQKWLLKVKTLWNHNVSIAVLLFICRSFITCVEKGTSIFGNKIGISQVLFSLLGENHNIVALRQIC